jgi:hypothetical protein
LAVTKYDAGWSSPVARQAHNLKVTGSNPVPATNIQRPASSGPFCFLLTLAADSNLSSAARKQAKPKPQDRKLKAYPKTNITYRPHGANQAGRFAFKADQHQPARPESAGFLALPDPPRISA